LETRNLLHIFPPSKVAENPKIYFDDGSEMTQADSYKFVWKNAATAPFDSGSFRQMTSGSPILICGQSKRYQGATLTSKKLIDEANKVKKALPDQAHTLIVFSSAANPFKSENEIPDDCVLVCGPALEEFYGPVLADHVAFTIESSTRPMNVNTASFQE